MGVCFRSSSCWLWTSSAVQANSVAHALRYAFRLPAAVPAAACWPVVVLLASSRGLRGVARLMQWIVPFYGAVVDRHQPARSACGTCRPCRRFRHHLFAAPSAGRRPPPAR
ncbi:hypothetical protein MJ579_04540 [Klebsiella pneumoniae]|nr:hypothetical protein MJ579_04540 [Klebsiella pneumoniae]